MTRGVWLLLCLPLCATAADVYDIDSAHTFPSFTVSHMGYSMHSGRFNRTRGEFVIDRKGAASSVTVVIQTASVDTGDPALEEKLRGAEFFDVGKFPEMTYQSSAVRWTGDSTAEIDGELTLLGVTRPVRLDVTRMHCDVHVYFRTPWCGFAAEATLRRSEFGMNAGIPMVGDEVRISIQAEGGRRRDRGRPAR
jgi:polyisoprenoid-binding protein YceI